MRFSVDLMRHTFFGTLPGDNRVEVAVAVLGALGVASFLLAMLGFWKERVLMEKDIHPNSTSSGCDPAPRLPGLEVLQDPALQLAELG